MIERLTNRGRVGDARADDRPTFQGDVKEISRHQQRLPRFCDRRPGNAFDATPRLQAFGSLRNSITLGPISIDAGFVDLELADTSFQGAQFILVGDI
jgi:hypothetical protein